MPGEDRAAGDGVTRRRPVLRVECLVVLLMACVVLAIALHAGRNVFRPRVREPDLTTIRRIVALPLPADTVLLDSYEEYSREMELLARLRLSHDSAKALLSRLPPGCERCRPGELDRPLVRKVPSWWQPEAAPDRVCVRLAPPAARGYGQLVVALGEGDHVTLYLYWGSL